METERTALNIGPALIEAVKEQRIALVCAAAVAIMAIGVFHAPPEPVLLGCGGAVSLLVFWGILKRILKN